MRVEQCKHFKGKRLLLKETVEGYQGYSKTEIMDSIEVDSITEETEYPIEKRGIYYLSRRLCSQLNIVTEKTDYGQMKKCYIIFICRDRIPKDEQMSISFYKIVNDKNAGHCHQKEVVYDLMLLVIICL